jgi:hypothetical protein
MLVVSGSRRAAEAAVVEDVTTGGNDNGYTHK